jgi:hypothetical protein
VLRVSTPLSLLLPLNVALFALILLPLIVPLPPLILLLAPPLRPLRSSILSPGLLAWSTIIRLLPQYSSVMKSRLLDCPP